MIFFNIVWLHINFDQIYGTITIFLLPSQHYPQVIHGLFQSSFTPCRGIPTKKPTVQKPCIDRADPDFSGLHNEKERQILRFNALSQVHLQGLEPWAH